MTNNYMVILPNSDDNCLMFKIIGDCNKSDVRDILTMYFALKRLNLINYNLEKYLKFNGCKTSYIPDEELEEVLLSEEYKIINLSDLYDYMNFQLSR